MTEKFTISNEFEGNEREIITRAVEKSKLPEGINIIAWNETYGAKLPFAVIAFAPRWKDARTAYENGATTYVRMDINPESLTEELNKGL